MTIILNYTNQKKTELINSCSTFTDLILYYNALCKTDSVDFIFCIQQTKHPWGSIVFHQIFSFA